MPMKTWEAIGEGLPEASWALLLNNLILGMFWDQALLGKWIAWTAHGNMRKYGSRAIVFFRTSGCEIMKRKHFEIDSMCFSETFFYFSLFTCGTFYCCVGLTLWGCSTALLPARHTVLPARHTVLPARHTVLPTRHTVLPARHTVLPARHTVLPSRHTVLPSRHTVLPARHKVLPARHTVLPARHTVLPARHTVLPARHTVLPARHTVLPARHTVLPARHTVLPARHTVLPARHTVLPTRHTVLPAQQEILPVLCAVQRAAAQHEILPAWHEVLPARSPVVQYSPQGRWTRAARGTSGTCQLSRTFGGRCGGRSLPRPHRPRRPPPRSDWTVCWQRTWRLQVGHLDPASRGGVTWPYVDHALRACWVSCWSDMQVASPRERKQTAGHAATLGDARWRHADVRGTQALLGFVHQAAVNSCLCKHTRYIQTHYKHSIISCCL